MPPPMLLLPMLLLLLPLPPPLPLPLLPLLLLPVWHTQHSTAKLPTSPLHRSCPTTRSHARRYLCVSSSSLLMLHFFHPCPPPPHLS